MNTTQKTTARMTAMLALLVTGFEQAADVPQGKSATPQSQIGSALTGVWHFDSAVTASLWPNSKSPTLQELEFKFSEGRVVIELAKAESSPALDYWNRKEVTVAEFGLPPDSEGSKKSIQCTVIGKGASARLIATTLVDNSAAGVHAYSTKAPTAAKEALALSGYWTKVDDVNGDIVKLTNGGIVEVIGYVGYVGYGKRAFLRPTSRRLWIEGKKDYGVSVLKAPSLAPQSTYQAKTISRAADDGSLFVFTDGSIFDPLISTYIGAYSEYQSCFILDGSTLLFEDGAFIESGMLR